MKADTGKKSFRYYIVIYLKGFCVGLGNILPGISGGTMALMLGIYEDLLSAVRTLDLRLAKLVLRFKFKEAMQAVPLAFLVPLGLGILSAIFTFARIINWLLEYHPLILWPFFFGLVLASALVVSRHLKNWDAKRAIFLAVGALTSFTLVGLVPARTPDTGWFLFITGAFAVCASFLPGLSGDLVLVLFGKYQYVISAVSNLEISTLLFVAAGCVAGLISIVRILQWLLNRYHDLTMATLTGFMLGSLRRLWPWKETIQVALDRHGKIVPIVQSNVLPSEWNGEVAMTVIYMIVSFLLVLGMEALSAKKE